MAGQVGPRTRGNAPRRPLQQNIATLSTPSAAFGRRCSTEFTRLQVQLSQNLQDDISRIGTCRTFCDLELECSSRIILTHRCILETRATRFYTQVCVGKSKEVQNNTWRVKLPAGVADDIIHDFVKNLYILEDPSEGENRVLAYLQQFYVASPDSEAYETPQCSPDDAKDYGFCEESCEDLRASLGRSSAHYYSIVPLDDICSEPPCRSTDLLDQELEEQDELIRSFQCIKVNTQFNTINTQLKKPTYLQLSSRQTKNNNFLAKPKAQQEAFLILEEQPNKLQNNCESDEQEDILLSCISSPCSVDMDPPSRTLDSGVDCGVITEDQTMSISHPSSSSPLLPRDHTVSETSGLSTLDDGKHNCTTMASISDAESDHEFPDEPEDSNVDKLTEVNSSKSKECSEVVENVIKIKKDGKNVEETQLTITEANKKEHESPDIQVKLIETLVEKISINTEVDQLTNKFESVKIEKKPTSSESSSKTISNVMESISKSEPSESATESTFDCPKSTHKSTTKSTAADVAESATSIACDSIEPTIKNATKVSAVKSSPIIAEPATKIACNSIECAASVSSNLTEPIAKSSIISNETATAGSVSANIPVKEVKQIDKDMPFCLVTSIEQEYSDGNIILHTNGSDHHVNPPPQFMTYDINRSSNKSSGNFFIDASSLLDDSEISSGDWLQTGKEEKICIAGVTTTSSDDHTTDLITGAVGDSEVSQELQVKETLKTDSAIKEVPIDASYVISPSSENIKAKSDATIKNKIILSEDLNTMESTTDSLSSGISFKQSNKLETSVVDSKIHAVFQPQLTTFISVDMTRSAPAIITSKSRDDRPKSLDCSQLLESKFAECSQSATLPRRNTFELEADGKEISVIRQEHEKKQGQMLFNSCIPAFSQHVTGSEGKLTGNKLPLTPGNDAASTECCYPSMEYQAANSGQPYKHVAPPTVEEEVHSPDSLNNDGPMEAFCEENITFNVVQEPPKPENKPVEVHKKQKYDESMPIVSGGVSSKDYEVEVKESPLSRRRIESTPILSGANMTLMETPNSSPRFPRKIDATAWVVDMSDPNDVKSPEARRKMRTKVIPSQLETVQILEQDTEVVKRKNSGLGFFVDLSDTESTTKVPTPPPVVEAKPAEPVEKKKSFFSMYIDIGDNKPKGEMPKRPERRPFSRETSREDKPEPQKSVETEESKPEVTKEKQGFFMFIEADPPVVRRQTVSGHRPNVNRHSWNAEGKPVIEEPKKHKRAQSLCNDRAFHPEELQKSPSLSKIKQLGSQTLTEEMHTNESKPKPKLEYLERSEMRVMTRSMDETLTTEVKLRTGRAELEPVMENSESRKQFVRLSDMDGRGVTKHETRQPGDGRARTRKVEETSWIESKLMVRGSRGLVRSKSPGSMASTSFISCHSPSQDTDESELSSMQSSVDRSGLDASTEETDLSSSYPGRGGPCSRLGEDLLRMFLEEINTDVTVEVAGRRIRAHKCILSSRCQYFAAMLSGGWVESAGNVISLQGFSYHAVHFALSHIYSGTNNIPDSLSIVELATLTDMLGLEGLKEVIMYTLKVKYCHFFHKPCSVCAVGVLECLPLAAAYGLDEIYHKSLRWITKYFVRIWPSKAFASLPRELVDKCYLQHVVHMSVDSVLDTVMSCDRLLATLPSVRWAEAVYSLTSQLLDACVTFMAEHFSGVLTSDRFVSLGKELSWNISRLEDSIMAAVDCLPAEQACQSHTKLCRILAVTTAPEPPPEMQWSASFVELLERIKIRAEGVLIRLGARAMRCKSWPMLGANMRTKVQEAACLGSDQEEGRRARSLSLTKRGKRARGSSTSAYGTTPRYSGGRLIGAAPPCFDLRQVTLAMSRGERVPPVAQVQPMPPRRGPEGCTNPEKPVLTRTRQARPRPTNENKQTANSDTTTASGRPKTWPMKVLEQNKTRANQKPSSGGSSTTASRTATPEKSAVPPRMKASSSESSRTSSPASRDKTRKGPAPRRPIEPMKSASSSHIPVANSKPFLSPVLRGSREVHDSPTSKSVSELTRTKNSPIPALKSRIMARSSQPCLAERRLSSGSIKLTKSIEVSSPSHGPNKASHQSSPLRKSVTESPKPPFKLGTSTENLRKSTLLNDKPRTPIAKRSIKSQENVTQSVKTNDVRASPRVRRLADQRNDKKEVTQKGPRKAPASRPPIPLSQSSSAPAINKGFKPKLLSATSRSGTFLKDEPTVLKKPVV